jgi:hypothetical protein
MLIDRFDQVKLVIKNIAAHSITAGAPYTIWTPSPATDKFRIFGWSLSLSVDGEILFIDGSTEAFRTPAMKGGIGLVGDLPFSGYLSSTAGNALALDVSSTGSVSGFVYGVEEM